jgi:hypothetical protein
MVSRKLVAIRKSRLGPQSNERQPKKAIELIHKGRFVGGTSRGSPETALWEVSTHPDYIAVFRAARRQLADLQSESRADCTLKRRVTRMVCQPCVDRSRIRQVFATFGLDFLKRVLARQSRNAPVSFALRCGLRNGKGATTAQQSAAHPPTTGPPVRAFVRRR